MGYCDHLNDSPDNFVICHKCGKKYRQWTEDQVSGCRDMDYDICPYCGNRNGTSMEVEYHNEKLD